MGNGDDLLTTTQAARLLGVTRGAISKAIHSTGPNKLPAREAAMPAGDSWKLISRADLLAWNERRPTVRAKRREQVVRDYKEGRREA